MNVNSIAVIFLMLNAALLLLLPRRWASLPLLIGACYMPLAQGIEIGPFTFTVVRILVAAGVVRIIIRGERLTGGMNAMDWLMLVWSAWALTSSVFHHNYSDALILRLGLVYNACGIYFLLRVFCQSLDDVVGLCRIMAILLVPVAVEMLYEKLTLHNLFSTLGAAEGPAIREGKIRAQGPFSHSILAGTIGAVSIPLMIGLWHRYRKEAMAGIYACLVMVITSASSGPIISTTVGIGALMMWRFRHRMRLIRWLAVFGIIGLDLIMKAPVYYLIARIDLTGGSTGWHRARLIESAFQHLSEWWLAGTDYTRHWMPTGVSWNPDHTDITNYYLKTGVIGGLPLMLLLIAVLAMGFVFVGQALRQTADLTHRSQFMIWALGASLFAHAATFVSVSYFDQSFLFIYLTLALIGSAWSSTVMFREESEDIEPAEMQQIQS
ncbi:MAG: hypothetical protein ACOYW7_13180 [Nitrospirota bacterium]